MVQKNFGGYLGFAGGVSDRASSVLAVFEKYLDVVFDRVAKGEDVV